MKKYAGALRAYQVAYGNNNTGYEASLEGHRIYYADLMYAIAEALREHKTLFPDAHHTLGVQSKIQSLAYFRLYEYGIAPEDAEKYRHVRLSSKDAKYAERIITDPDYTPTIIAEWRVAIGKVTREENNLHVEFLNQTLTHGYDSIYRSSIPSATGTYIIGNYFTERKPSEKLRSFNTPLIFVDAEHDGKINEFPGRISYNIHRAVNDAVAAVWNKRQEHSGLAVDNLLHIALIRADCKKDLYEACRSEYDISAPHEISAEVLQGTGASICRAVYELEKITDEENEQVILTVRRVEIVENTWMINHAEMDKAFPLRITTRIKRCVR